MAISTFEADEIVARANVNQRINQANAYFPVSVANGGTGKTSLTSGNILLGNGTSGITSTATLPITKGGTGSQAIIEGVVVSNGTLLYGQTVLPQSKGGTGTSSFYESGSWTPSIKNGAGQYLSRSGIYYRIGEMVFVSCTLQVSGTSSSSNYGVVITGLPYRAEAYYACAIGQARGLINEPVTARVYGSEITFDSAVKSGDYYPNPHLPNSVYATIIISGWYKRA